MADRLSFEVKGLEFLRELESLPADVALAAQRSVNRATRNARSRSGKRLRDQIAFGARYLTGADGQIVMKPASPGRLEARLSASSNPRSLARFVSGSSRKKGKIKVEVSPGRIRGLPGAFLLNISGGEGESSNTLLAVRSRQKPSAAYKPRRIGTGGLWSLYGPSVAQALINSNGRGIWADMEPEILLEIEEEFFRQIELLRRQRNG